jgi:hypothetical protein
VLLEYFFSRKFDHKVTAACGLAIKAVSGIQKDLMRANRPIRRAKRAADKAVEVSEIIVAGQ